jgi:hypothetical protein
MKPISLQDYARAVGYKGKYPTTLKQVQEYAEDFLDWNIWDYPLEELEYCKENELNVILVETDLGLRLCEI